MSNGTLQVIDSLSANTHVEKLGKNINGPQQILLIDDEPSLRQVVQTCLEILAGWQIIPVSSAEEALVLLSQWKPDAILLDMMMPEMDGFTFIKHFKTFPNYNATPIVILTAKTSQRDLEEYQKLGVAGVLAKPFNPLTIASEIAQILGWQLEP